MKRKGRLCALIMALALACTGFSACNSQGGENSSSTEPDSSAQGSSDTAAADTSDEELSIHYLSARASTEGSLLSLQKIADEYKETHPNFTYEAEIFRTDLRTCKSFGFLPPAMNFRNGLIRMRIPSLLSL